jgi:hypothetical protein
MSIRILLTHYQVSQDISKDFLQREMPESILAQALQGDPEAKEIEIPSVDVTPKALDILHQLSEGKRPEKSEPECLAAARYLNYPLLGSFSSPLYDQVLGRELNEIKNWWLLRNANIIDTFLPYLIWQKYDFELLSLDELCEFISKSSKQGARLLLQQRTIDERTNTARLWYLAKENHGEYVMERLFEDSRIRKHTEWWYIWTDTFMEKYTDFCVKVALSPEIPKILPWQYTLLLNHLVAKGDYETLDELIRKHSQI